MRQLARALACTLLLVVFGSCSRGETDDARREVVFWHFWGGKDRAVVDGIVERFNASQTDFRVRAIALPGRNLDVKFFLSVAGGDPPDLLNQDDPVIADWAERGAIMPLSEVASPQELAGLDEWLFPAARELGTYRGAYYALANGLDIRCLYYDKTLLDAAHVAPPRTLEELDRAADALTPPAVRGERMRYGFLPDPRRLWAWGIVFGGRFYEARRGEPTANDPRIVAALDWMASYGRRYGAAEIARFRTGDQALVGAPSPLLQGRYAMLMDGQWRVAELSAFQDEERAAGRTPHEFGVVPLPPPKGGLPNAGWVNGNFFVIPRGAHNKPGAWAFMKFWSGYGGMEQHAAAACAAGGWIPASPRVVREPGFKRYLDRYPLFRTFVEQAASPNQVPTPNIPGAPFYFAEVNRAAEDAMYGRGTPQAELDRATDRTRQRMREVERAVHGGARP